MNSLILKKLYGAKTTGPLKTLELTDEQYRRLILLLSVGSRTIVRTTDAIEKGLIDIEQYVTSFSGSFSSSDLITYNAQMGWYLSSDTMDSLTNNIIDFYDQHTLIFELSRLLVKRDIELTGNYNNADAEEVEQREVAYWTEFENNGFENLWLKKNSA